ncbi:MAG: right-handed parallel beta-helix repeat-containing protein, partial [Bacilli bacterium]
VFISSTSGSVAKNHNISIYATDESGIAHLKYDWFKEETGITRGEITTRIVNNEINPNFVNQPEDPNGTYYLWVYVKDNAQNRRHFKVGPFEFDNEAPKNIEVTSTPSSFTNGSVTLTVTAEDNYGVEAYQFNDNEWQTLNSFEFDNNQEVIIRVRDIVGNIGTTTFNIENIDKEGPKTFNFSPKMLKTLEVKQLFNINDITVTAYDTEDKDNHLASIVSIGYDQDGGNKFIEVNNIDTSKIGKYRICYKATDHAGNEGEKCVTLKVDVPDQHAYNETQGKLHTSLRVALRDAKPNDRIIVGSGIYNNDFIIDKDGIVLKSLNGINNTLVNGSFTITSDNVTLEGFHIKARSNYKTTPVIHMIDIKNVSILNNKVESWYKTTNQSAIGTYTGPANITGIIKGNTVEGAIGVGTDGNLEVSNNTVTGAAHEGIWFYPIANTAKLVIKNNIVTNQGAGFSQLKIVSRPTSINNRTDDIAMYNILFNNNKALDSIKLDWIVTENIQTAINNAVPGSKIYIAPGTYNEALLINKEGISLQAIGEVIISPNNISTAAITITANDVIVNGFNIKNSYAGLFVTNNANNVMISNNNISDSINGVAIHKYASDITINKNVISNIIDYGIVIGFNNDNNPIFATGIKITNNTITNTGKDGIYADYLSSNNRYLNNIIIGSGGNGIHLYKSNNDVIRNNIIQNSLANGISLMGSYKNSILNNEIINNNQYGIEIRFSYGTGNPSDNGGNIIRNNTIQNNDNNNTQIYEYAKEGYENEYGRNKSTGNNFGNAINPIISEFEENKAIIIE